VAGERTDRDSEPSAASRRFSVVVGLHPGADDPETDSRLLTELARAGAGSLSISIEQEKRYSLELRSDSVDDVLATVTRVFRSVYGPRWWAEVTEIQCDGHRTVADHAGRASWN
jgi:hypothetical protein